MRAFSTWPCVLRAFVWLSAAVLISTTGRGQSPPLTFEQHIRPILKAYCLDCHGGGDELKGNLDLRLRRLLLQGGESGAGMKPGEPDASLIVHRLRDGEMPPGEKKLPAADLERIREWIRIGAPTLRPEPEMLDKGIGITAEERAFWAFQPLARRPAPLDAKHVTRYRSPVDAFVVAKAQEQGIELADDADPGTLLRRAAFDLTGLPPDQETLDTFAATAGPDAFERALDRLLASPRYGERWGRHWLDVAGYADSDGYTSADAVRPYAYKYRDYVIRSLNADKPLDRFVTEQLAGDELVGGATTNFTPEQIELLTATGYLRMAADGTGSGAPDADLARNQVVTDTLRIVGTGLLGLSVQCAQCHDHRYDPIPQADYYRLRAVFEPALDWKSWRTPQQRLVSLYTDADRARAAEAEAAAQQIAAEKNERQQKYLAAALDKELLKFPEAQRGELRAAYETPADKRSEAQQKLLKENPSVNITPGVLYQYDAAAADDLKKYDERIAAARAKKPVEDFLHTLVEPPNVNPTTFLFHRGDHRQPKDAMLPGDLTICSPPGQRADFPADDPSMPTTGRRLAWARRLTDGTHPLFGRALANRLWLHHFGRGLVGTPGDLGMLGERPSHPELLDWLASELPASQWSLKRWHRLVMSSTVYRLSSARTAPGAMLDQDNRYLARASVRRLEAESLRDRMLWSAGTLGARMYGPSVAVKEDDVGQIVVAGDDSRRSVYLQTRRSQPVTLLVAFDLPVMETNCERRSTSTVAPQSLMLMNGDFVLKQAAEMARRARDKANLAMDESRSPTAPSERTGPPSELAGQLAVRIESQRRNWAWQYGAGEFDPTTQRTISFQRLPHWTGSAWQGGPELPDPTWGWVTLHATGGHPGDDARRSAMRRWTAPRAGTVQISGSLAHPSDQGDGVRASVVSSRTGLAGQWIAQHGSAETNVAGLAVERGDTIDLIVDCRGSVGFDSYSWTFDFTLQAPAANGLPAATTTWLAQRDFRGPQAVLPGMVATVDHAWQLAYGRWPSPRERELALDHLARQIDYLRTAPETVVPNGLANDHELQALANLCQVLLTSNEFLYVD